MLVKQFFARIDPTRGGYIKLATYLLIKESIAITRVAPSVWITTKVFSLTGVL